MASFQKTRAIAEKKTRRIWIWTSMRKRITRSTRMSFWTEWGSSSCQWSLQCHIGPAGLGWRTYWVSCAHSHSHCQWAGNLYHRGGIRFFTHIPRDWLLRPVSWEYEFKRVQSSIKCDWDHSEHRGTIHLLSYDFKWHIFMSWYGSRYVISFQYSIYDMLCFLQDIKAALWG